MQKINKIENFIISNENRIKISSKEIKKGDIFLALKGNNCHGNKFIKESINNGAAFCITERSISINQSNEKILIVKTLVFPLPAPAKTKKAPSVLVTAFNW